MENNKSIDQLEQNFNKLEQDFKDALKIAEKEINEEIKNAKLALKKAEKISEKYGIPFESSISPIWQNYKPKSFDKKWGKLNEYEDEDEETFFQKLELEIPEYEGWQHSAVC